VLSHATRYWILTGLGVTLVLAIWLGWRSKGNLWNLTLWYVLVVLAVLVGYTRYSVAYRVPDRRIGQIENGRYIEREPLRDTSRLIVRVDADVEEAVGFRFAGELVARQAVLDYDENPLLDEAGRWVFNEHRMPIKSATVDIPAHTPAGATFRVDQPFSRIDDVLWDVGDADLPLTVFRLSNHIGSFVRPARGQSDVTVLGRIAQDPNVYDFKSVLTVEPAYIQYPAGGPYYRVEGGDIQVTVHPNLENFTRLAQTEAYGADIVIRGELTVARGPSVEGGFDARRFMQNHNIYAVMRPYARPREPSPVSLLAPTGQPQRSGNPLVAFSLGLRDRMLGIFKATMPYPQSAFLGGVTLGLRYGLHGVMFPGEGPGWMQRFGLAPSEAQIVSDFRASGVNHVLAVSGLHVTILTVMFVAIFSLIKFPRQVFVPVVIGVLVIFAIITGARPSTLRAVIMNSLFLLTWAYLDKGLRSSVLTGVPIAAALILVHNPLVVVDPSFTLSFGAILSLALLTGPIYAQLCRLRGNCFASVILCTVLTTLFAAIRWALVTTAQFWIPWSMFWGLVFWVARACDRTGIGIDSRFRFTRIPESIGTFMAAQIAIQIGMMIPLSAYYFNQWPFGGMYANLIAIPLIGVVVQLGVLAGLLGLIPGLGPLLALFLNAANWLAASLFLWLAYVFARVFPHPFVPRPSGYALLFYYGVLALLVWPDPVQRYGSRLLGKLGVSWKGPKRWIPYGIAMVGFLLLLVRGGTPWRSDSSDPLEVTVLPVGYGSAIHVQSPGGAHYLIDSGFVEYERGRRNEAMRTILPTFSHQRIGKLDMFIASSPRPERAGGLSYILMHQRIKSLILPFERSEITSIDRENHSHPRADDIFSVWAGDPQWPQRPSVLERLHKREGTWFNRWASWNLMATPVEEPTVLVEEEHDGGIFRIEVVSVLPEQGPWYTRSMQVRILYGAFSMLLPGAMELEAQRDFAMSADPAHIRANILVAPYQAAAPFPPTVQGNVQRMRSVLQDSTGVLLAAVEPEDIILEFGNPRPVLGREGRDALDRFGVTRRFYIDYGVRVWSTDRDQAIYITSDGATYQIDTQAQRNRTQGGLDETVSDVAIGL